jgi:hypothetical protein
VPYQSAKTPLAISHTFLGGGANLVHLYAERGSPKYEKAALRWLERYLTEGAPRRHFAEVAADLARRGE